MKMPWCKPLCFEQNLQYLCNRKPTPSVGIKGNCTTLVRDEIGLEEPQKMTDMS